MPRRGPYEKYNEPNSNMDIPKSTLRSWKSAEAKNIKENITRDPSTGNQTAGKIQNVELNDDNNMSWEGNMRNINDSFTSMNLQYEANEEYLFDVKETITEPKNLVDFDAIRHRMVSLILSKYLRGRSQNTQR